MAGSPSLAPGVASVIHLLLLWLHWRTCACVCVETSRATLITLTSSISSPLPALSAPFPRASLCQVLGRQERVKAGASPACTAAGPQTRAGPSNTFPAEVLLGVG